jgi:hypothetical protein
VNGSIIPIWRAETSMYQVQHYRKIQTAVGLRNVVAHNMRHGIYDEKGKEISNLQTSEKWYDPTMAEQNKYSSDIKNPEQVLKKRDDKIKNANLKRKVQKNSSYAIEGVFSASPEFAEKWRTSKKDNDLWKKYLDESTEWAAKKFGSQNVLHIAHHMDEKTPHMHIIFVPLMKDKNNDLKYSSGSFLGGRTGLQKAHTQYHRDIGKKYGLDRGELGSRQKHDYIKGLWTKEKELIKKELELEKMRKDVNRKIDLFEGKLPVITIPEEKSVFKRSVFYEHNSSDGINKFSDYKKFVAHETELQKENYYKEVKIRGDVFKEKYRNEKGLKEIAENRLSEVRKRLVEVEKKLNEYEQMTPKQFAKLVEKRALKRSKSIVNENDFGIGD